MKLNETFARRFFARWFADRGGSVTLANVVVDDDAVANVDDDGFDVVSVETAVVVVAASSFGDVELVAVVVVVVVDVVVTEAFVDLCRLLMFHNDITDFVGVVGIADDDEDTSFDDVLATLRIGLSVSLSALPLARGGIRTFTTSS